MATSTINRKEDMHNFVSSFLHEITNLVKHSRIEILNGINSYIKKNKDILRVENDSKSFKIINELKIFFDNCKSIAKIRGEDIIIPEVMKYTEIMRYLKYCIYEKSDIYYIPNEEDLKYKKYFIETIWDELYSIILGPDRMSIWIHCGHDVNLTLFADSSKFI